MKWTLSFLFSLAVSSAPSFAESLRIGLVFPQESPLISSSGNEMLCISRSYIEEAMRTRKLPVELKLYDNKRDPLVTAEVARQIIQDKVDLVIGTTLSKTALAAARILNPEKVLFFTPNASLPEITEDKVFVFQYTADDLQQTAQIVTYVTENINPQRVLVVQNLSSPYSTGHAERFSREIKEKNPNVEIQITGYIDERTWTSKVVQTIREFQPDFIFTPISGLHLAALYIELKDLDRDYFLFGSDNIGGRPEFFAAIGKTSKRLKTYFLSQWSGKIDSKAADEFKKIHSKHCSHQSITMPMVSAFDLTRMVVGVIEDHPNLSNDELRRIFSNTKHHGVMGPVAYRNSNRVQRSYYLYEISDNSKQMIGPLKP